MHPSTRREFLGEIGHGMLLATLGSTCLSNLGGRIATRAAARPRPLGDDLEALIRRMQQVAPDELLPQLVKRLEAGTSVQTLIAAGALANARTFGGGDYEGYHAFMALLPAYYMGKQMPAGLEPLPALKVLYRNSARMQKAGGGREVLGKIEPAEAAAGEPTLRQRVRAADMAGAERVFARCCSQGVATAYDDLQDTVEDDLNVHRIVLAWRAWDLLQFAGPEHAHTLLRQVVRFCVDEEKNRIDKGRPAPAVREDVPRILDQHKLLQQPVGKRVAEDGWVEALAGLVFASERARAADAVAAALAEGFAPEAVGEAISLAANELVLHDTGKQRVHGASIGVHASDAANAWRNVARANPHHCMASLVVGAYHTAGQSQGVGAARWSFAEQLESLRGRDAAGLLAAATAAIEQRDQHTACAAMQLYGEAGHATEPALQLLLRYAVSEDGALHAEKYFHTVHEEFGRTRPALRWRRIVALARVTASEFGEPAPGVDVARRLLST